MTLCLSILAAAVAGQPPAVPEAARPVSSLEISLLPGVWFPRLDGEVSLGAGVAEIELGDQLDLNDAEATPNVELTIRRREMWDLILSGFHFSTDTSGFFLGGGTFGGLALAPGDMIRGSFEITSVAGEVAVALGRPYADGRREAGVENANWEGRYIADLRFGPIFGMRYLDVDHELTLVGGGTETTGGEWLAVYGGIDFSLEYRPERRLPMVTMTRVYASAALGPALGGGDGFYWQIRAGLALHVTEHFGVMFGYRLVELDVENDDYSLSGGLQGLFVAASLRF